MSEASKQLVRGFVEVCINGRALDRTEEFWARDAVDHSPFLGQPPTLEGMRTGMRAILDAFPDFRYEIDLVVAEGDLVVIRGTTTGTNTGSLMGMPPTGRAFRNTGTHIARVRDGRLVEHWGNDDDLSMLQQLGVVPEMAGA